MAYDAHANFAYSTVATAPSPATSGTSLTVASGDGSKFPAAPFNATVWPSGAQPTLANAEIVRVTAISTDTFTITRAQESSTAQSIATGYQIAATITKKTLTDIEANATGGGGAYASPQIIICDAFTKGLETQSGTMNLASTASKGFTYDSMGIFSAFSSNFYATARRRTNASNAKNFFSGSSTFAFGARDISGNFSTNASGIYAHAIMGSYDIGSVAAPSYTTVQHYGFTFSRVGSTFTSSFSNGDGTTAVSTSFTMSGSSDTLFAIKNGTTNIKYYDNGTLLGTVTTNLPTTMVNYLWSLSVSNTDATANGGFGAEFITITKDAY